jgi:P22 coat protein - gene protein 5
MANSFSKEERVAFEDILEGFNDALVLSKNVSLYRTNSTEMARTNDIIWRPQPYIAQSYDGMDQSLNFQNMTQLSVPATLGFKKSVPWIMDALELRDALQEGRLGDAAKQKLASDINLAIMNVAALQGSLVVFSLAAAGDYDDVALCDTIMNEQGVQAFDRYLGLSSRDYNGMAGNLATATRSFGNQISDQAYRRGFVGTVAGFQTYKFDYANRIRAAGGSDPTIDTRASANNYWVPQATSVASTGESANVDNRFQTITHSSVTTELAAGDAITISGVEAVHHITKQSTGELKTFRIVQRLTATTSVITPPIISAQGGTDAELQYQNCIVTPAASATMDRLNIVAAPINCFWQKDALEILPGRYAVPTDAGAAVMRASTDQGIELVMQKQYDVNTMKTKYRLDTLFGVVNKQPEMSGILLFGQSVGP